MKRLLQYGINPTAIIFAISFIWFFTNFALGLWFVDRAPWMLAPIFLINTAMVVWMFTPVHDAVHRTASKSPFWNEFMLIFSSPLFISSGVLFRRIHLVHHARTNQPHSDPDQFTKSNSLFMRWVRSFFLIFHYYVYALRYFWRTPKYLFHSFLSWIAIVCLLTLCFVSEFRWAILFGWVLPSYIGLGILAFINTSWPHHPGEDRGRFKNTRNLYVPRWLQWVMLNQNLHFVHHYRPNIPWYEYPDFWAQHKEALEKKGAVSTPYTQREAPFRPF